MNITIDDWQGVDEDSLNSEKQALFLKRKKAVMMLVNGVKFTAIHNITGITRNNLLRLIDRCEEVDEFGLKYGFKALIPYKRINKYNKKSTKGYQGAFTKLLRDYPELKSHIENLFLGKRIEGIKFRELSITNVHKSFISYCRKLNISENNYPLSTKTKGRESLRQYCKNLSKTNLILDTHNRRSVDNANDLRAFQEKTDKKIIKISKRPYSLVQIDGHSADAAFLLNTYNPYNEEKVVVYRFWLILAIDVASRKVLGYSFSLNKNYRLLDLIYCLINSLTGRQLYTTSTFMSDESSTSSTAFDMITLDNHMSHRSPQLIDKLCKITGATVRLNPGRRPRANAVVERVFKSLKPTSTDIVPSSLGSYPSSPKRFMPDKFAKQSEIDYGFITNLIEQTIKDYNNKFHSSIGSSPNEYIERYLKRNTFPFRKVKTDTLFDLLTKKAKVNVRGKTNSQIRPPHINFLRAKYYATNVDLAACYYGESVTVVYNLLDLRVFKVYLSNGEELCDFVVEDKWNKRHSFYERKLINNILNKEEIMYDPNDYVGSVIRHVKKSRGHKKDMLRKIKQGDVDRLQRVSSIKNLNDESNTSFTYPKFNIFDNQ